MSGQSAGRDVTSAGSVYVEWDPDPGSNIAGYRVHFGTESRTYTESFEVGLETEAEIPGLELGRLFYCAVTSYTTTGRESPYSDELPIFYGPDIPQAPDVGQLILIDPQNQSSPLLATSSTTPTVQNSGLTTDPADLLLDFEAPAAADYSLWCRFTGMPNVTDSLIIVIDGLDVGILSLQPDSLTTTDPEAPDGFWARLQSSSGQPVAVSLAAGFHSLGLHGLPAEIAIDRLALSANSNFVPTDALPRNGAAVTLLSKPEASLTVEEGSRVNLAASAVGTGPIYYQWFLDGLVLAGENSPSLTMDRVSLACAGSYVLTVSSEGNSIATSPAELIVSKAPFAVRSMTMAANHSVSFDVSGAVGGTITVFASCDLRSWSPIASAINQTGRITVSDPEAEGCPARFYRLEIP